MSERRAILGRRSLLRRATGALVAGTIALAACTSGSAVFRKGDKTPGRSALVGALGTVVRNGRGLAGAPPTAEERSQLQTLYQHSGNMPYWLKPKGEFRAVGKEAFDRLVHADAEGLEPEDYGAHQLDSLAQATAAAKDPDPQAMARLDASLSLGLLRFLRDSHVGRVNPQSIGFSMSPPRERHDYVLLIESAAREGTLEDALAELMPPLGQYRLVRDALAKYRSIKPDSLGEAQVTLKVPIKAGSTAPGLDALARRLAYLGDLPSMRVSGYTRLDGELLDAVRRFQGRHGITPDSTLGKATLEALNAPLSWRIHQLELALERLRWLRDLPDAPYVMVNIPMFELTVWNSPRDAGPPVFRTGVIVGKALDKQTPVLVEEMRYVIFQPYWNIPLSIARDEVIPEVQKNPDYLRRNNMEIVDGQGDDADPVEVSDGALDQVLEGDLRIRQRPGPGNALGPIKFVFPNDQNVYLHGTPAEQLFDRNRRDFSHGCVRVEDPTGLAEWVLRDQPEWGRDRIIEAMEDTEKTSRRVSLTRPLTVLLFYNTAVVEADGTVRFADDIYGHDRKLDAALHVATP